MGWWWLQLWVLSRSEFQIFFYCSFPTQGYFDSRYEERDDKTIVAPTAGHNVWSYPKINSTHTGAKLNFSCKTQFSSKLIFATISIFMPKIWTVIFEFDFYILAFECFWMGNSTMDLIFILYPNIPMHQTMRGKGKNGAKSLAWHKLKYVLIYNEELSLLCR